MPVKRPGVQSVRGRSGEWGKTAVAKGIPIQLF